MISFEQYSSQYLLLALAIGTASLLGAHLDLAVVSVTSKQTSFMDVQMNLLPFFETPIRLCIKCQEDMCPGNLVLHDLTMCDLYEKKTFLIQFFQVNA